MEFIELVGDFLDALSRLGGHSRGRGSGDVHRLLPGGFRAINAGAHLAFDPVGSAK